MSDGSLDSLPHSVASPVSISGRILACATLFSLLAFIDLSLTGLLSYLVWLLSIAWACGSYYRPKLHVRALPVRLVSNQQNFELAIVVSNVGRRAAYDLNIHPFDTPRGLVVRSRIPSIEILPVDQEATFAIQCKAVQRGVYRLPSLRIASHFPLGLFHFGSKYDLDRMQVVVPDYGPDEVMEFEQKGVLRSTECAGLRLGERSIDYLGSREYRPGMLVRRWDFASWARLGKPATREYADGTSALAAILVDCRIERECVDSILEDVLSRAACMVAHFVTHGDVDLILVGHTIEAYHSHDYPSPREELLTRLAEVHGCTVPADGELAWDYLLALPSDATIVAIAGEDSAMARRALCEQAVGLREVIPYLVRRRET